MLKVGDIVEKKYKIKKKLGKGGGGSVYLVEQILPPPQRFALKIMEDAKINNEITVGLRLGAKCSSLVKVEEVIAKEEGLILIMEYCDGGDLAKKIEKHEPVSDFEIYRFVFESSVAVKTLHDENVIHRDIKPSNFFIMTTGGYKLGDYGMALTLDVPAAKTLTLAGSNGYIPPEIMEGKRYTKKSDIFSLGVTFMEFILGKNPFMLPGQGVNITMVTKGVIVEAARTHPHPIMQLARRMISVNPEERPSVEEVLGLPVLVPALQAALKTCDATRLQKKAPLASGESSDLRAQLNAELRCSAMLQSFVYSKPIADFGFRIEKFIPTGKEWTKRSITVWELVLADYTYEVTASSVWDDREDHAPQNLFDGKSETFWWVWAAKVGHGELLIKLQKPELLHYVYMQARMDGCVDQTPVRFNVLGSTDGEHYDMLGQFQGLEWAGSEEKLPFPLMTKKGYTHYKVELLESRNPSYVGLAQLNFGVLREGK